MSHVDDGMLHAYLDGGLSALDAVRVERHVAECAACQQRLDTARGLIQRAARLLEWASPPADRAAPPLAALRPHVVPRWRVPVAWAATIVIALGAGIYGGQILLQTDQSVAESKLASSSREAEADQRAAPITVLADTPLARQAAAPAQTPLATAQAAPGGNTTGVVPAQRDTTPTVKEMADAVAKTSTDTLAALAARRSRQEAPAGVTALAPAAAAPAAQRESSTVNANQMAGERRAAGAAFSFSPPKAAESGAVLPIITVDSARALLGSAPVAVPDYPVNAIRASAGGTVTVEQVIPPGRVIRLLQRRAAADEEGRAPSEALARYVDGLRVEIVGPMPADSLSVMLGRARAVP